jgi:hypothetical protein
MKKVQVDIVQSHLILGEGVQSHLLSTPIKIISPIIDQPPNPSDIGAVRPGRTGRLVWEARMFETLTRVGDIRFRNAELEYLRLPIH